MGTRAEKACRRSIAIRVRLARLAIIAGRHRSRRALRARDIVLGALDDGVDVGLIAVLLLEREPALERRLDLDRLGQAPQQAIVEGASTVSKERSEERAHRTAARFCSRVSRSM